MGEDDFTVARTEGLPGEFSDEGSAYCSLCPAGTYIEQPPLGLLNNQLCNRVSCLTWKPASWSVIAPCVSDNLNIEEPPHTSPGLFQQDDSQHSSHVLCGFLSTATLFVGFRLVFVLLAVCRRNPGTRRAWTAQKAAGLRVVAGELPSEVSQSAEAPKSKIFGFAFSLMALSSLEL